MLGASRLVRLGPREASAGSFGGQSDRASRIEARGAAIASWRAQLRAEAGRRREERGGEWTGVRGEIKEGGEG